MGRQLGIAAILALAIVGLASARGPPVDGPADACQACLVSVRILEDFLCDPAATDFLVDFVEKQICARMGEKEQCHNLAEGLLPTVIQWFRASATPASLCSAAGVCGAAALQIAPLNKPALRLRDTSECAMCKFVVRTVQQQIEDSQTLEKIKEMALQICSDLPGELAEGCTDFVDNYGPMISQLVEDMDPETVCAMIGTCMEGLTAVKPPALPAALVQALAGSQIFRRPPPPPPVFGALLGLPPAVFGPPAGGPGGMMAMMMGPGMGMGMRHQEQGPDADGDAKQGSDQDGGKSWWSMMMPAHGPMGQPFANDACDYCKMAVIEAHSLVSNPTVQAEVTNYTKAVCESFPAFAEPCKAYVDMYAPLVFTLLEQYLVPDAVCAQTGMCPPPPKAMTMSALADGSAFGGPHPHPPRGSWTCWLMDGWFGELLRHLGLGRVLPHHKQEEQHQMRREEELRLPAQ